MLAEVRAILLGESSPTPWLECRKRSCGFSKRAYSISHSCSALASFLGRFAHCRLYLVSGRGRVNSWKCLSCWWSRLWRRGGLFCILPYRLRRLSDSESRRHRARLRAGRGIRPRALGARLVDKTILRDQRSCVRNGLSRYACRVRSLAAFRG